MIAVWVGVALGAGTPSSEEVLAGFAHEPGIVVVQRWAEETAHVSPEVVRRWLRDSRVSAALPALVVEWRSGSDWSNDFQPFDADGNPPVSNAVPTQDVLVGADVGEDRALVVRATWDLAALVSSPDRLRAVHEAQDAVKLRERVLSEVTRLYFERRRLQVDVRLSPRGDARGQIEDELRLRELTAALDGWTGGRFAAALDAASAP